MGASDQVAESWGHALMDSHISNMAMLLQILEECLNRKNYTGEDMRGIAVILKHMKRGGNVNMSSVDAVDSEAISSILKQLKVPYAVMRDGESDKCVFVTRDIQRDRALVKEAFKRFAADKGADLQQIPIAEFLRYNENKSVKHMDGLDKSQVEVFRERMKKYQGQYAIVTNSEDPDKLDIYYPDKGSRTVEGAIKDMMYDFSGPEGKAYKKSVDAFIVQKENFIKNLTPPADGVIYAVSKSDPTKFITIANDGYAIHRAKCVKSIDRDGKEHLTMSDRSPDRHLLGTKAELADDILRYLPDAVMMTAAEMSIVKSLSSTGQCLFVKDSEFKDSFAEFANRLSGMEPALPLSPANRDLTKHKELTSYLNIERDQIDKIVDILKDSNLDRKVSIADNGSSFSIAFPKDDTAVKEIVDDVLFGGLSGIQALNSRLYNEGRSTTDFYNPGNIIIDAGRPGAAIMMSDTGANVMQGQGGEGENLLALDKRQDDYEASLTQIILSMKEPVVMSKEDYDRQMNNPEEFSKTLRSRIPTEFDTPAEKEYYKTAEQKQQAIYEELHKRDNAVDIKDLPERSQEALRSFKDMEIRENYVERSMFEKITEMDFSDRRLVETQITTEETISR